LLKITASSFIDIVGVVILYTTKKNKIINDGDGINDLFVAGMQAQIIDRYGMLVYSGNKGWDGTFNGKRLDNDTYFYQITYTDLKGIEHKVKGNVTLKR
jgi:gliding motility-associated-like protein